MVANLAWEQLPKIKPAVNRLRVGNSDIVTQFSWKCRPKTNDKTSCAEKISILSITGQRATKSRI